jgi:hypothetical protein
LKILFIPFSRVSPLVVVRGHRFAVASGLRIQGDQLFLAGPLFAQGPSRSFSSHIFWKQAAQGVSESVLDQAAADSAGDLWFIPDPPGAEPRTARLVQTDGNGAIVSEDQLPESINPSFPEVSDFALTVASTDRPGYT